MALKRASSLVSNIKTSFTKSKFKQPTAITPESEADITTASQAATEASTDVSEDTLRVVVATPKQADIRITEPFADFAESAPSEISGETAIVSFTSQSPFTTNRSTYARPFDVMSKHASLLPIPSPQATIIDLSSELSKTDRFTSPLPVNPAAAPLCRTHFKCLEKHAYLKKSSNVYAPTLCTTCHGMGQSVLACCQCCYLRMCKRCARLLSKSRNDLECMLEELVRLGAWRGLQGQG